MLDGVFNMDNPLFRFMNRIADMIVLNVIFLVSCVPIFTIGPALTALYYVAINTWGREDGYIFKMYIKSFKENFKQSTVMWLILLAVGIILSVDVWYWVSQWKATGTGIYKPLTVVSVVMLMVYLMIFTFVWPLLAKFSNSNRGTIKNALAMVLTHVPETILIWAIFALVALIVYMVSFARIAVFFIGVSLIAYLQALVFRHIFKPYLGEEEHKTPEEEAGLVGYDNAYADSKIEVAKLAEEMARKTEYRENFDLCVSRAVANLASLSEYCLPFVTQGGSFISYKSGEIEEELSQSKKAIFVLGGKIESVKKFRLVETDAERSFVQIKKVKKTPKTYPRKAGTPSKNPIQ